MNFLPIKNTFFISLLIWSGLTAGVHPFYLSVCEMDYNQESNRFELAIKLFSDDISDAIKEASGKKLFLGEDRELDSANEELSQYINNRLTVWVNDAPISFTFIGKEIINDVTWCYIESEELPEIESMKVRNQVMMEMFKTQKNIVHITINDKKKSLLLQRGKEEMTVAF